MNQFKIKQMKDADDPNFIAFWNIYNTSFPLNERRVFNQQTEVFKKQEYQVDAYLSDNQIIGFIAYWTTKDFIFVEHLAITPEVRSNGFGSAILKPFIERETIPVILEIEPVINDLTRRRLKFYESLGFVRNDHIHYQPPYHHEDQPLLLDVLTWPHTIDQELYRQFSQFLKNTVMGK
ncbi:MAG: GNAT family N-acetyltransferase [Mariniphaga sp.]|nr:GNAT family N-acetyltransferase [Mariniphaga sp.]